MFLSEDKMPSVIIHSEDFHTYVAIAGKLDLSHFVTFCVNKILPLSIKIILLPGNQFCMTSPVQCVFNGGSRISQRGLHQPVWVFPNWFHWIRWIQWQSKRARTYHPATSCVRDQDAYHSTNKTHVRDRIFTLSLIHASVIYQFPWIRWIQWIPVPFKENSIIWQNERNWTERGLASLQFRISPHRHNAILGIENWVQKGLFP